MSAKNPSASSPCMMDQAEDAYAGYIPPGELIELLNTLAEAERAGVKVVQAMREETADDGVRTLLEHVRHDEARYCGMVSRMVEQLGGTPSRETGAFFGKVMALDGLEAKLALLNRGQGWVVRKLEEVLPRLRDDTMHAELKEMIDTHNANISACDRVLGA